MRKGFSLVAVLLVLSGLTTTAQIPRTLQIGVTNGTATIFSQNLPGYFVGELETTTNLSPPIVWHAINPNDIATNLESGESDHFSVTNSESFFRLLQRWPVFEFGIFYNIDLDFSPGQPFTMNGTVFANGDIWMCPGPTTTFNETVSATLLVTNADNPNDQQGLIFNSNYIVYNGGQPNSHAAPITLDTDFNTSTNLARAMLDLPPPGAGAPNENAYAPSNQVYLYNEVDLIISNSISGTNILRSSYTPTGTNLMIYFQYPSSAFTAPATGYLTRLTNDFYTLKTGGWTNYVSPLISAGKDSYTNVLYAGWSFVTNVAFYDYRESDTVQAVQIDIAAFSRWLTNALPGGGTNWNNLKFYLQGHGIDSIYVYNSVPLTATTLPAVRVVNGQQLPFTIYGVYHGYWTAGLTVATPMPIYVWGNYNIQTNSGGGSSAGTTNTTWTRPAALMGDAVTILSGGWSDGNGEFPGGVIATTVNAAILTGIVPSTFTTQKHYSGGVENFLRLLENWNATTLTYNGSIVAMFPSVYATNYWVTPGTYYGVPTRAWGFDANFSKGPGYFPPLTPFVANFVDP